MTDLLARLDEIANAHPTDLVRIGDVRRPAAEAAAEIRALRRTLGDITTLATGGTLDCECEDDDR